MVLEALLKSRTAMLGQWWKPPINGKLTYLLVVDVAFV